METNMKKYISAILISLTTAASAFAEELPMTAFDELEISSASTVAAVKVLSEAKCGEIDPYILGDVCWQSVEVLETGETLFIHVPMFDTELKVNDEVTIKYLKLASGLFEGAIVAKQIQ